MVVMEALSSGIIPIVSPLPVFTAMHEADPDPILVLTRDWTPAAVAEAIMDVISQPERMLPMRARCRAFAVRHLDWEVVAGHYRDILDRLSNLHDSH